MPKEAVKCKTTATIIQLAIYLFIYFYLFIYLKLRVCVYVRQQYAVVKKHRNMSYTGVTRQGRMALTGANA